MRWKKLGLVYCPDGTLPWAIHSALTPTPIILPDGTVRVFAGLRDSRGVSRIGAIDLDPANPTRVLRVSPEPVLDIGAPGAFDDNGVILGDVIPDAGGLLMFYVGFQLVEKVKFLAFTGAARSTDGGMSFVRISSAPVLDRCDAGLFVNAVHTAFREGASLRIWCGAGSRWEMINGSPYPSYGITTTVGDITSGFAPNPVTCIAPTGDEYRIGRPRVYRAEQGWRMFYTVGTRSGSYLPGFATSDDGVVWHRRDAEIGLAPSETGWDSKALSYVSLFLSEGRTYCVYNGNEMGKTGFGLAELESW